MYPVYMYGIFNIQSNFIICHLVIYVIFVRIIFVFEKCIIMFSDHPSTIKKRFLSVLFMLIFSPLYTWYFIHDKIQVRFRQNINIFYIFKIKNFSGLNFILVGFEMGWTIYICCVLICLNKYFVFGFNMFNWF